MLDFQTVDGGKLGVRRVLRSEWLIVAESFEGFADVVGHGEVTGMGFVVPVELDTTVKAAGPVCGGFIERILIFVIL